MHIITLIFYVEGNKYLKIHSFLLLLLHSEGSFVRFCSSRFCGNVIAQVSTMKNICCICEWSPSPRANLKHWSNIYKDRET